MDEILLDDGKYRFYKEDHLLLCERYGEKWRDFLGDHAVTGLFNECLELKRKLSSLMIEEKSGDGCCGFKYPEECPHDGIFDSLNMVCKECADDAAKAMVDERNNKSLS